MTCKFFNIIDYSILGFQHLIYVLECIYIIILYQPGQLVYFPNKFSTISLISILSNERQPFRLLPDCVFISCKQKKPRISRTVFNEIKRNAMSLFGVGYVWIVFDSNADLQIITTPNKSSLIADDLCVLAVIDLG